MKQLIRSVMVLAVLTAPLAAETYTIDPIHSRVGFRVRHMMISKVTGHFDKFSGAISYDPKDQKLWSAEAVINAASINTGVEKRDEHLRSPDFFDVQKYPTITFKGFKVLAAKDSAAKVEGDLTMHGVTKPVVLDVEIGGITNDPWGNKRLGGSATAKINRKDFGLTWNKALEAGGVMVGEEVEITLDIEAVAESAKKK